MRLLYALIVYVKQIQRDIFRRKLFFLAGVIDYYERECKTLIELQSPSV